MTAKMRVQDAGTLRTITRGWVKQAGVLRRLRTIKVMDGGSLRTVAIFVDPFSLSASPSGASAEGSGSLPLTLAAGPVTAVPSGGQAPFSYSWAHLSDDTATISHPTSATTSFSRSVNPGQFLEGTFRCTATDAYGATATTDVGIQFTHSGV